MRLSHIKVQNYRSFLEADMELRPLTLIYGENNAGKSALLRLLSITGQALGMPPGAPLPSGLYAMRGGGPASLFSTLRGRMGLPDALTITLVIGPHEATWTFTDADKQTGFIQVRSLVLRSDDAVIRLELRADMDGEGDAAYYFIDGDIDALVLITWRGLLPETNISCGLPIDWLKALRSLAGAVQWIDSGRQRIQRRYTRPQRPLRWLKPDGQDTPQALWGNPALLDDVNAWFNGCFARTLKLHTSADSPDDFRLDVVAEIGQPPVPMADGGEGLGQVLPIIVALSMARQEGVTGRILALEEPESHLHTTHHEALMNELVRTATAPTDATVVVETHSQELLLAALLAIAEGRIRAEDVIVHYVYRDTTPFAAAGPTPGASRFVSETFDDKGRPSHGVLPSDLFNSDTVLLQRLFAYQLGG